ncbi:MAG TPA: hypothetical protein VNT01_17210 [Symbiobacteriaceae bacterium]|nr:hypothetical protein [Symbiobacteriaceae bacterium]
MRQAIQEGLNLAEQLAALPFKAARQAFEQSESNQRPWGELVRESMGIGEGLARLPFKATAVLLSEVARPGPSLEERVAELERRLGVNPAPPPENAG